MANNLENPDNSAWHKRLRETNVRTQRLESMSNIRGVGRGGGFQSLTRPQGPGLSSFIASGNTQPQGHHPPQPTQIKPEMSQAVASAAAPATKKDDVKDKDSTESKQSSTPDVAEDSPDAATPDDKILDEHVPAQPTRKDLKEQARKEAITKSRQCDVDTMIEKAKKAVEELQADYSRVFGQLSTHGIKFNIKDPTTGETKEKHISLDDKVTELTIGQSISVNNLAVGDVLANKLATTSATSELALHKVQELEDKLKDLQITSNANSSRVGHVKNSNDETRKRAKADAEAMHSLKLVIRINRGQVKTLDIDTLKELATNFINERVADHNTANQVIREDFANVFTLMKEKNKILWDQNGQANIPVMARFKNPNLRNQVLSLWRGYCYVYNDAYNNTTMADLTREGKETWRIQEALPNYVIRENREYANKAFEVQLKNIGYVKDKGKDKDGKDIAKEVLPHKENFTNSNSPEYIYYVHEKGERYVNRKLSIRTYRNPFFQKPNEVSEENLRSFTRKRNFAALQIRKNEAFIKSVIGKDCPFPQPENLENIDPNSVKI